jgi:hypothetical protein
MNKLNKNYHESIYFLSQNINEDFFMIHYSLVKIQPHNIVINAHIPESL